MRKGLRSFGMLLLTGGHPGGDGKAPHWLRPTERYLHVKVEDSSKGESVNVNLPLSMAEKILPTVEQRIPPQRPRYHRRS